MGERGGELKRGGGRESGRERERERREESGKD